MLDFFGMDKANTKEAIREIANGVTTGLIDAYTWQISEKDREILKLKEELAENEKWKERYQELSNVMKNLKEEKEKAN